MEFEWRGYKKKKILHKHFGENPVKVYAIKLNKNIKTCVYCGKNLTEEEIKYYHNTCESCETSICEELKKEVDEVPKNWNSKMWRKGRCY